MNIQINTANSNVDWSALLNKLDAASKAVEAQGAGSVANVTITASVDGVSRTVALPVPDDLEIPGAIDQTAIDSLCSKLSDDASLGLSEAEVGAVHHALSATLAAAAPTLTSTASTGSKSVMFDLYQLMALLVEVGQKQRDAAREMREAESAQIQKAIQSQADQQKAAALTGMIAGAICCAIQVAVSLGMLAKQGSSFRQQIKTLDTSGVTSARQNLAMTTAADSADAAKTQLAKANASVGGKAAGDTTVRDSVKAGFERSQNAGEGPRKAYDDAKAKLEADTAKLQRLADPHAALEEGDVPPESELAKAQKSLAEFDRKMDRIDQLDGMDPRPPEETKELNDLRAEMANQDRASLMEKVSQERKALAEQTRTGLTADKTAVEEARVAYRGAVKGDLARYEDEFKAALNERSLAKNPTPTEKAELDAKVQLAADKLQYARAFANDRLAQPGVTTAQERALDIRVAGDAVEAAEHARHLDVGFLKASRAIQASEAQLGIVTAIGNATQSFISGLSSYIQTEAKEDEAKQTRAQEELDQTKDLFDQAQDLVDAVVQLMQAVSSAESQSMRDAIQA